MVYELKGKLIKIDWDGKNSPNPSIMKFGLYIKSDEDTKEDNIYISPNLLSKTKVYLVHNDVEKLTDISQLKEGDNVVYQHFEDLSHKKSDKNYIEFLSIKIIR